MIEFTNDKSIVVYVIVDKNNEPVAISSTEPSGDISYLVRYVSQ